MLEIAMEQAIHVRRLNHASFHRTDGNDARARSTTHQERQLAKGLVDAHDTELDRRVVRGAEHDAALAVEDLEDALLVVVLLQQYLAIGVGARLRAGKELHDDDRATTYDIQSTL
mgnify:FL=1